MEHWKDYQPLEILHESDHIIVFRAQHAVTQKKVIIKSLKSNRPSLEQLSTFRHEYQINHGLNLPGLVHCQQLIEQADAHQLIYDDVGGIPLKQFLKAQPITLDIFFPIALEIVSCIADLHANKIIHKDIKPDNILINPDNLSVKILDLSMASQLSVETQEAVSVNKLEGSLPYMAPEQTGRMNRPIDYRSDYYALGITFYEMLTGALPFVSLDPIEYIHFHLAIEAKPVAKVDGAVPEMLSRLVAKLMAKDPGDRYQSAAGLRADLERCFKEWKGTHKILEFSLGKHEVYDRLSLSPTVYGRETEIEKLLASFERINKGGLECLMISGYSGIGKTTIVNALQKLITIRKGQFIAGKYDQLLRTTPFTAFTAAFSMLFQYWLTEPDNKLKLRKEKLQEALGESAQVLIQFLPQLELLMGKQKPLEELPPEQAQNRLLYVFQKFIAAICSPDEPLVMFIDDLQWMDSGSLRLLELILSSQDVNSLLFIGAYRDNEVDETTPFIKLLEKLKKSAVPITDIKVSPLTLNDIERFLSDTLRMDISRVKDLAAVIFEKTAGNPFFAKEFLKECFNLELLSFSMDKTTWVWNIKKIITMAGSDNVVDLMLSKIHKLPETTQISLQRGACVGMAFEGSTLCSIQEVSELEISESLAFALKEGLLQRTDNGLTYKFIHDRIQQAAYETLSKDQKQQIHLKLGRILQGNINPQEDGALIFEVLDHFKRCAALIESHEDQLELANLALTAGVKAKDSGAYSATIEYLNLGLSWTQGLDWDDHHDLKWQLSYELMTCLYLNALPQEALELSKALIENSINNLEKAKIYNIQMKISISAGDKAAHLRAYINALATFGVTFPEKASRINVLFQYFMFIFRQGGRKKLLNHALNIKRINDESNLLFVDIGVVGTYFLKPSLQVISSIKIGYFAFKHGGTNYMVFSGLDTLSHLLSVNIIGRVKAIKTLEGYGNRNIIIDIQNLQVYRNANIDFFKKNEFSPSFKAECLFRFAARDYGFFSNFSDLVSDHEKSIASFAEFGSYMIIFAVYSYLETCCSSDVNLNDMKNKMNAFLKVAAKIRSSRLSDPAKIALISTQHLLEENGVLLNDVIAAMPKNSGIMASFLVSNCYLVEEFLQAKKYLEHWFVKNGKGFGNAHMFFLSISLMILAQLYSQQTRSAKKKYLKSMKGLLANIEKAAKQRPENFMHVYLLGKAEIERIEGEPLRTIDLYHQAIKQATGNGFLRWAAIANERLGELYLHLEDPIAAGSYFQEAIYYFQQWGCNLKVHALKKKYANLLRQKQISSVNDRSGNLVSSVMMTSDLDLGSMLKANQAISSEIELSKLLPNILKLVIESAGAEKGVFIGLKDEDWIIEAQGRTVGNDCVITTESIPLKQSQDLPQELVAYALRSGIQELIGDMVNDPRYNQLNYVRENNVKSVLCLPILRADSTIAALYLENNLTTQAFTPERIEFLQALSTQIAISIENARNFENTQELYRATERFVPKKFLELLNRKNIKDIQIGDSVEIELSAIFADLRNFTTLAESLKPEDLTYILNTYLKYMAPIIRKHNGFVNRVLGDGILALFPIQTEDAVLAALEMLEALHQFNEEIKQAGFESISMGIGVNTGPAMLCALGEGERIEASVVSDMVNAASRIEGLNKMYGTDVLISDTTFNGLKNVSQFSLKMVDTIRVKGKTKALSIYEARSGNKNDELNEHKDYDIAYDKAFELYKKGSFRKALQGFEKCLTLKPNDAIAQLFKDRCEQFIKSPPENWDGSMTMLEK